MIPPMSLPFSVFSPNDSIEEIIEDADLLDSINASDDENFRFENTDFWLKVLVLIQCLGRAIFVDTQGTAWSDIVCAYQELASADDINYSEQFCRLVYRINYLNPPGDDPLFVQWVLKPYSASHNFQNRLPSSQRYGSLETV